MGILATDNKQLIFIYSESSQIGKKVLAHINTIDRPKRIININNETISKTIWLEISAMLDKDLGDLFDTTSIKSKISTESDELSVGDWLKMIKHNPELLQQPIIIDGTDAKVLTQTEDIYNYFEADGSDFDKSKEAIKTAQHKDSSDENMLNKSIA
tara:strand:- start:17308 stop:17775 length:468 start_codon:yes stop_codon:yes gene_type:complete